MIDPFPLLHLPITAPEPLTAGRVWRVEPVDQERLQLRDVRTGEAFTVCDPTGAWFRARLDPPSGARATAFEAIPSPESSLRLSLFQAILARERMFWVVQKATELGAHWIVPTFTARSLGPADLEREKAHRWPAAILRAVKQCRRATVPVLLPPASLAEALALGPWRDAQTHWVMAEPADAGVPGAACQVPRGTQRGQLATSGHGTRHPARGTASGASSAALAVGPEGGWTDDEAELLARAGATPVTLGGRILRAETATLVGLTLLQWECGDWRKS